MDNAKEVSLDSHRLEREQWIPRRRDEVFSFFSNASNLGRITPPWVGFRILGSDPVELTEGATIDYAIKLAGIPMKWRTIIASWNPPYRFRDVQARGPYAMWDHAHEFHAHAGGTLVVDRVLYRLPLGLLGRLVHVAAVRASVSAIFDHRFDAIRSIFGGDDRSEVGLAGRTCSDDRDGLVGVRSS